MNRYGSLDQMAECALLLVSRDTYITGEVVNADGGCSADVCRYWKDREE
jgi:3-oxoacyl-[acyl-carrier protein] reductase